MEIKKETWLKRDRNGQKVGSVMQYPIVLAYAVTCHKSQGLTLSSAIVHCLREFVSGLIYVAVSRVRSPAHIQILSFNWSQLMKPPRSAVETCISRHLCAPQDDLSCCRRKRFDSETFLIVKERFEDLEEDHESFSFPQELLDQRVQECFEVSEPVPMEMCELYDRLIRHESILAVPPEESLVQSSEFLLCKKTTSFSSTFRGEKKDAIASLLDGANQNKLLPFTRLIWFHSFLMVEKYIVESPEDQVVVSFSRQVFTDVKGSLYEFLSSNEFSGYVCQLFATAKCSPAQRGVAVELATALHHQFLDRVKFVMNELRQEEAVSFDVEQMSGVGRSKIRHVGGWAVKKVLNRARKYIQRNVYTNCVSTLSSVKRRQTVCELLEENVIQPFVELEEHSEFPETLEVTEGRQYRERGLLHISDGAYLFFLYLEKKRVELLNRQLLRKAREEMVETALNELNDDKELKTRWFSCFHDVANKHEVISAFL